MCVHKQLQVGLVLHDNFQFNLEASRGDISHTISYVCGLITLVI